MKLFLKRYALNIVLSISFYSLIFLVSFLISNEVHFFHYSLIMFVSFFLLIRVCDDYFDFYKDKINDKVLFNRITLLITAICLSAIYIVFTIISGCYLFFALYALLIISQLIRKWYITSLLAPVACIFICFYAFKELVPAIVFTSLAFVLSIIFAFRKKKTIYSLNEVGGKGYHLLKMDLKETPIFIVVPASALFPYNEELVEAYIKSFCKKHKLYAVRSSGIDEDSDNYSFAGVHDTFLNVKYNDIEENIKKVINSAASELAINYRKNNHLQTSNIRIAVVIQEMVDADYAGVINTINPVTNNTFETVISVCKGTGEKLVNGDIDATNYYVNGKNIITKGEDILSKELINKVVKLSNKVALKTDRFQDIEFAIKGHKVYFLQTRAITTYKDINSKELTLLIDNSNIIESYYGVVSPLTASFAKEIYEAVYKATFATVKAPKKIMDALDNSFKNMLYVYEGKIYYNLFSWYHVTGVFPSRKSLSYMESMMGVKTSSSSKRRVKFDLFSLIKSGTIFLNKLTNIIPLSDKFLNRFNEIVGPYYGKQLNLTNEECINLYNQISKNIVPEFTTPIFNDTAVMFYFGSLKEKAKKYQDADKIIATAINNNGEVESAASATEFEKILNYINSNKTIKEEFVALSIEELMDKYHQKDNALSEMISGYVHGYGSRVMDELKLETITMIEDPSMIFKMIKQSLTFESSSTVTIEKVEIPKKLIKLANKARKYIQNRERLRLRRTYIFSIVRNIFLNMGRNFVKENRIDDERDVFYLTKDEVFSLKKDYRNIIKERKAQQEIYKKSEYYDRVAFYNHKPLPVLFGEGVGDLHGIPSGKGKVTARVSVLENSTDSFTPGNIILTKRTDPGWISLFPLASGLIVEHGSMLSHSFVVAREIGLPAIVGVSDARKYIKDGDIVTLDATKGEITIEH